MKRLIALTVVALASQAVAIFAGEPMVFEASYCSTSTTAARVLQTQRIRYRSVRDLCEGVGSGNKPATCTVGEEAWT